MHYVYTAAISGGQLDPTQWFVALASGCILIPSVIVHQELSNLVQNSLIIGGI